MKILTNKKGCDRPDLRGLHVGRRYSPWDIAYNVNIWVVGDDGTILAADDRVVNTDPGMLSVIADFVRAWPNTSFILSCRELDYNRELSFQQILIKPFDRTHIRRYMKKYFGTSDYKPLFRQIVSSSGVYELCATPFYLDLVCYFCKFYRQIPQTKAQLFSFIVTQFVERENKKQATRVSTDHFIAAISHLATI